MSSSQAGARAPVSSRFFIRVGLFVSICAALVWSLGELVRCFVPWLALQDPRRRLLWEEDLSRWRIFLLGDSAFCSNFVDRPEETLWARLSKLQNEEVFPGALNGATEEQVIEQARLLTRAGSIGSRVVFLDVVATKFLRFGQPLEGSNAVYDKALARRFAGKLRLPCSLDEVEAWLLYNCTKPFFLLRCRDATEALVKAAGHRPRYFHDGANRDRVWRDGSGFARERFERFLESRNNSRTAPTLDWVLRACAVLRGAGIRPVVVIYPLNRALIQDYLGTVDGEKLYGQFARARQAEMAKLRGRGIDTVDLLDRVPSEGFADLVHTNVRGDEIVAQELHSWFGLAGRSDHPPTIK
ncbi:MAG: hypothetical protein LAO05_10445 [Acidobacteriia bacterium]|nr:hypothetical protein [Terriglobia bacterium]